MAAYQKIDDGLLEQFHHIVGRDHVGTKEDILQDHSHDETEDLSYLPEVVIFPAKPTEISGILRLCNEHRIPVTPRAGGTGLSGGALPVQGGVALNIKRMNRILEIDTDNMQVHTEPGVITQVLQEAVEEVGLYYPPDPASRGTCFIGGNIAENSGGPRAVKYGVVKDYVLNLEVVLPNGDIIWTGANTLKNATGYNLTQLMVGSEGTLGIVTKIVLRLIPYPPHTLTLLAPFKRMGKASEVVAEIFKAGITPSAMEFMERDAIDWTLDFVGDVNLPVEEDVEAHLLIEVDGFSKELLFEDCERITGILERYEVGNILLAESAKQKEDLWRLRTRVSEAVKSRSVYKEEDTVVPRARLPKLLKGVKAIGKEYGFKSVCYGHVGDGNLHVNIIKGELSEEQWNTTLKQGIREIFTLVKELGGTISGEHGIGWVQKEYLDIVFSPVEMQLMKAIKLLFDPNQILNPGKIFPDTTN